MGDDADLDALNVAIAEEMVACGRQDLLPVGIDEDGSEYTRVPNFARSLDALRDGPERVLRDAGCFFSLALRIGSDSEIYGIGWLKNGGPHYGVYDGATEAEARARAVLAALRARKEA